jgi:nitrogen fixation protein
MDGQRHGLVAAGDPNADAEQDDVEAEGVNDLAHRGADGVAEDGGVLHVSAGLVDDGVVDHQVHHRAGGAVLLDQGYTLAAPEVGGLPCAVTEEAVEGVVRMLALRVGGGEHAGDGAAAGAEDPTGGDLAEAFAGWAREDGDGDRQQGLPEQRTLHHDRPPAGWSGAQSTWRKRGSRG